MPRLIGLIFMTTSELAESSRNNKHTVFSTTYGVSSRNLLIRYITRIDLRSSSNTHYFTQISCNMKLLNKPLQITLNQMDR